MRDVAVKSAEDALDVEPLKLGHDLLTRACERKILFKHRLQEVAAGSIRGYHAARMPLGGGEDGKVTKGDATGNDVPELADVTRPAVRLQPRDEFLGRAATGGVERTPEMAKEEPDIAFACTERRQLDTRDGEPIVEVLSKPPRLDFRLEVAPGRGENARVDPQPALAAHALDLAALECPKELGLQRRIEVADLVDEKGSSVCLLEDPFSRRHGAGEGAAFVPEEGRLGEGRRHRGAVEDDEGTAGPRTLLVKRLRQELLAGARLALDDDRDVARGQPLAQPVELAHGEASADDATESASARDLRLGRCGRRLRDLDRDARLAQAEPLAGRHVTFQKDGAAHHGAVRAPQIDDAQPPRRHLDGAMPPRYLRIAERQIARAALSDEDGPCSLRVDAKRQTRVGAFDHAKHESSDLLGRPLGLGAKQRGIVEIHRQRAYHAGASRPPGRGKGRNRDRGLRGAADELAAVKSTFAQPGVVRATLGYYRAMFDLRSRDAREMRARLARPIEVATLALTGALDGCMDTRLHDSAMHDADFARGLRVVRIEGAGHFLHQEKPEEVNRVIVDWLRTLA